MPFPVWFGLVLGAKFDVGPKGIDLYDVRKRPW
jgi:hypothetical protein